MSFRSRLSLFFMIIVIVPMIAVALALFSLTADSENGKADARIAEALTVTLSLYEEASERATPELARVANDPQVESTLAAGRGATAERRFRQLERRSRSVEAIALYDRGGRPEASAGAPSAIAPATAAPTTADGRRVGTLAVSTTTAASFARRVKRVTGLDVRVFRGDRGLSSTLRNDRFESRESGNVEIAGREYRARFQQIGEPSGPPLEVGLFSNAEDLSSSISDSRLLIAVILVAFLALALASSVLVVRALQGQVEQFLQAARRLGQGDFAHAVPTHGSDEFAALGTEFNKMSEQLEAKIEEVEGKRRELEETIRRVGDAFATGLDRRGLVELAVRTAVEACTAEIGRAVPIDAQKLEGVRVGDERPDLLAALEAAEKRAFEARPEDGRELMVMSEGDEPVDQRRATYAQVDEVHALAAPLRARLGSSGDLHYVGVLSIARRGEAFTESELDLFAYLAAQAAVSIENADLHETVQLQAVTDELTGLFNVRHFHAFLDGELERSKRFSGEFALVTMDIDNFKQVNDTYGHPQGDIVLIEVARVLRELSRDIDEPARIGGEEMGVILPQTDLAGAELAAERMRAAIGRLAIKRLDGEGSLKVTASFGVASLPASGSTKPELIAAADAALYRAKHAGKNRVERAEPATAAR